MDLIEQSLENIKEVIEIETNPKRLTKTERLDLYSELIAEIVERMKWESTEGEDRQV